MDLASILTFTNILICMLGVAAGIVIGALPGLTPTMGVALLLPITFGMDMLPSFALLLGIYVGGTYGGSIAAILIRTPGTPQAVATVLDGYPLARSGRASEALSTACIASGFGGIFSNIVLICLAGQIAKVALAFRSCRVFRDRHLRSQHGCQFLRQEHFQGALRLRRRSHNQHHRR